jgi:betaine-aldehyde dehydrogenase
MRSSYVEALPSLRSLFYGGKARDSANSQLEGVSNPATGESLGQVAVARREDVGLAVDAALAGFKEWRRVKLSERSAILREAASIIRENANRIALTDSADSGGPFKRMIRDAETGATAFEFFAGLATEMKGSTIPFESSSLNYSLREPLGVIVRINAYNHPFMFAAQKAAAPLIAGNVVIIKPPVQAPLSSLLLAELVGHLFPDGVLSVLPGGRECGEALVEHPNVAMIGLIGAPETGKAIARAAAQTLKKLSLELGGKNALVAYPDADPAKVAAGAVQGMNFTWCGQSCGSTSRVFLHDSIHDEVVARIKEAVGKLSFGIPTDPATEMGCLVSQQQLEKTRTYVRYGLEEGATILTGGSNVNDPAFANGYFYPPTVFIDVTPNMRIAREEIFGPVMSILKWSDEQEMIQAVNNSELGLTASIWSRDLSNAHRAAERIEAGYIWVNGSSTHFLGAPFGGYKHSGLGREESIEELYACTQLKNVNISY